MATLSNFEIELLRWFQSHRIEAFDSFFHALSSSTTLLAIVGVLVISAFYFFKKDSISKIDFVSFWALFATSLSINVILKYLIARPRPFVSYPEILKLYDAGPHSFPSGHTITAFAIAFGVLYIVKKRMYAVPVFIWAILVAYSRLILGSHYISDVLTSIVIATVLYLVILSKRNQAKNAA